MYTGYNRQWILTDCDGTDARRAGSQNEVNSAYIQKCLKWIKKNTIVGCDWSRFKCRHKSQKVIWNDRTDINCQRKFRFASSSNRISRVAALPLNYKIMIKYMSQTTIRRYWCVIDFVVL